MWRFTPSTSKTVISCFHLINKLAHATINVVVVLTYETYSKYLGVTLDRILSYKRHLSTYNKN